MGTKRNPVRYISASIFLGSIAVLITLIYAPNLAKKFESKILESPQTENPQKKSSNLLYQDHTELRILESLQKNPLFLNQCIRKKKCVFSFFFNPEIPLNIQNGIKRSIRENFSESKKPDQSSLYLKFEIFTSKKDPYLKSKSGSRKNSGKIPNDISALKIEDLFTETTNNESLIFQIDVFQNENKIQEISFNVAPKTKSTQQTEFEQKKTR